MSGALVVALVGDHDPAVTAHRAIPLALAHSAGRLGLRAIAEWHPTESLGDGLTPALLAAHAVWCVPASPYRSETGALRAIRYARERGVPFLGTCGGFQHALLEYARHVAGATEAAHAETDPGAADPVIAPLACALVEATGEVLFVPGTRVAAAYEAPAAREGYHCSYGIAPAWERRLLEGPLVVSARDAAGEIRAVELVTHPFFVATLYQPERAGLAGAAPPIVTAFLAAAAARVHAGNAHPLAEAR